MGDAEQPGSQIFAGFSPLEVLKEGKKYFLNHFLGVGDVQAESQEIAQQAVPELIEESDDLFFEAVAISAQSGRGVVRECREGGERGGIGGHKLLSSVTLPQLVFRFRHSCSIFFLNDVKIV